jgi:hypothetical protein
MESVVLAETPSNEKTILNDVDVAHLVIAK